jgi:thiamine-phosphate diphosphorylase
MLSFYLVTDHQLCGQYGLLKTVRDAVRGGVTVVQLRDKTASTATLVKIGRELSTVLAETGVPLIVNDNVEAAIAINADGVHIGQSDMKVFKTRQLIGPDMMLGLSCETVQDAIQAPAELVDYIGVSPVFATATKADHSGAVGLNGLRAIAKVTSLPKIAIGGIKLHHLKAIFESGADGVAVVSAICGQPDVAAAAAALSREILQATVHRSVLRS